MRPGVIWITGLSGTGKTTVSRELASLLMDCGQCPVLLDGDEVREAIGDTSCGHDRESRLVNAYRICHLAKLFSGQGHVVIVATMSLFHEIHEWNRSHLGGYFETFLDNDVDILKKRDVKGHYERGTDLPGIDIVPELPLNPDLTVRNTDFSKSPKEIAELVKDAFAMEER